MKQNGGILGMVPILLNFVAVGAGLGLGTGMMCRVRKRKDSPANYQVLNQELV
jgi:hypothetical protein